MSDWLAPHPSTKYAVVRKPPGDYMVVAVHAINPAADFFLASIQFPVGEAHVYHAPATIATTRIMAMAQTTEAAWKYKRVIEDQDREANR